MPPVELALPIDAAIKGILAQRAARRKQEQEQSFRGQQQEEE